MGSRLYQKQNKDHRQPKHQTSQFTLLPEKENIEAVKQHLAAGTDVNAKGRNGWAPLHEAVSGGHNEIAELLIASAADVNAKDVGGYTPLDWAANNTIDLLRKHGGKTGEELKAEGK